MSMDITEFARLGGKARWKGTTKKQRSQAMSELARLSRKNRKPRKSGVNASLLENKKDIQQAISKNT